MRDSQPADAKSPDAPAAQAGALAVVPISGPLGLVDLHLPAQLLRPLHLEVTYTLPNQPPIVRTLHLADATVPVLRLTAPSPSADRTPWTVAIRLTTADGQAHDTGPRTCAPPAHLHTPDWAKGAVWYQVFPERFANGQPANDPAPGPATGTHAASRGGSSSGVFRPPWNSPWEHVSIDEIESLRAEAQSMHPALKPGAPRTPAELHRAVVFRRRYGGDLQGVEQRLAHLRALGITALYFTPVFRAHSLHKYDAADYRHIDEHFAGTTPLRADGAHDARETLDPSTWAWTPADVYVRDQFLPAARGAGFRVIFDGVWNHTGREFWAFDSVFREGEWSPYKDWYDVTFAPPDNQRSPEVAQQLGDLPGGALLSWKAWDRRNGGLPAFRQRRVADQQRAQPPARVELDGVAFTRPPMAQTPKQTDLATGPKAHVFDVTSRWMDPFGDGTARGIDGWRLDVAGDVGLPFWRDWRAHVKALNPDALLVAEIWQPAWDFLHGQGFDSQMNYPFARAVMGFLQLQPTIDAPALARRLQQVFIHHPATDLVQMNVLTSHDTDRLVSHLWNSPPEYDNSGQLEGATGARYRTGPPPAQAYARAALAVALQATYPGAPMIYYGEEWGMYGADDPHSRKPVPWPDLGPRDDPREAARPEVLAQYSALLNLRQHPQIGAALRLGAVQHRPEAAGNEPDVLVFDRQLGEVVVRVAINRGERTVPVDAPAGVQTVRPLPGDATVGTGVGPLGVLLSWWRLDQAP